MGAALRHYFCGGVFIVNGLPIIKARPQTFSSARIQTVRFSLEDNRLNIIPEEDELINTDSIISERNSKITILRQKGGIATRNGKISTIVSDLLRRLDDRYNVQKVVFVEPPTKNEHIQAVIFEAIFGGLHDFTSKHNPNYIRAVYIDWKGLSKEDMLTVIEEDLRSWGILQ